jgi:hypothetical protein
MSNIWELQLFCDGSNMLGGMDCNRKCNCTIRQHPVLRGNQRVEIPPQLGRE